MSGFLLGVDVGGSRTRALLTDLEGQALGYGEAGAGNHEVVGYGGLAAAMEAALSRALEGAGGAERGAERGAIIGAGFGVAGYDWESERGDTLAAIAPLGLACPIELRNDAALGLAAGAEAGWGLNLVAGTGNNCYGLSRDGREGRVTGAGSALGEEGGASEIAARALAVVNQARIRRIPPTALAQVLCRLTGMPDADSLAEAASLGQLQSSAAWAPEIFAAARAGDAAARGIVEWAGLELGETAAAVARQLGLEDETFELVLSGSLFGYEPRLEEGVAAVMARAAPGARIVRAPAPPVAGAVLLGARAAGLGGVGLIAPGLRARVLAGAAGLLSRA